MTGQPPLDLAIDRLPPSAVVADLVYVPLMTPLLAAARAVACAPPTASACCCTRRWGASALVRRAPAGDGGIACRHRGRPRPPDKSELKPGAQIIIMAATKQPDGSFQAPAINVGRGVTPPM